MLYKICQTKLLQIYNKLVYNIGNNVYIKNGGFRIVTGAGMPIFDYKGGDLGGGLFHT